jgi:hypothetical protein
MVTTVVAIDVVLQVRMHFIFCILSFNTHDTTTPLLVPTFVAYFLPAVSIIG